MATAMDSTPPRWKKMKSKLDDDVSDLSPLRRRCKSRGVCSSSPRNSRRVEDSRSKRRHTLRPNLTLLPFSPSPTPTPKETEIEGSLERIGRLMSDMFMWRDVAKSSLWFGIGSLFFLSSCFTKGLSFSLFSLVSKLGIFFMALSFFSNSFSQRNTSIQQTSDFGLKEDDILRVARLILPFANLAISKTRDVFSGDPSVTLKVTPFLLLGAEYGRVITLWRLCAIGFFFAFTVPKIYSWYSAQINQKVDYWKWRASEAWEACSHKKLVATVAVTAFWNLSTIKTRIFTAFITLVLIRYCRQNMAQELDDKVVVEEKGEEKGEENEQALVLVDQAVD